MTTSSTDSKENALRYYRNLHALGGPEFVQEIPSFPPQYRLGAYYDTVEYLEKIKNDLVPLPPESRIGITMIVNSLYRRGLSSGSTRELLICTPHDTERICPSGMPLLPGQGKDAVKDARSLLYRRAYWKLSDALRVRGTSVFLLERSGSAESPYVAVQAYYPVKQDRFREYKRISRARTQELYLKEVENGHLPQTDRQLRTDLELLDASLSDKKDHFLISDEEKLQKILAWCEEQGGAASMPFHLPVPSGFVSFPYGEERILLSYDSWKKDHETAIRLSVTEEREEQLMEVVSWRVQSNDRQPKDVFLPACISYRIYSQWEKKIRSEAAFLQNLTDIFCAVILFATLHVEIKTSTVKKSDKERTEEAAVEEPGIPQTSAGSSSGTYQNLFRTEYVLDPGVVSTKSGTSRKPVQYRQEVKGYYRRLRDGRVIWVNGFSRYKDKPKKTEGKKYRY